ncbi:MAG: hypothetical protein IAB19_03785 [Proteobacteria bacterium]|uniref:Lipoprotein n=1 Tax=Candidatus Avisuccinivibrio stercorigallinarum TaxID=2840704 RepID=A0A9D9DAT2_9GAMM|nr:hypothetical protein [Candidatus Avisuccinivibrio stercorigallinarum]
MNKLKVLTVSSVLSVLAASCDVSAAAQNSRPQFTGRSQSTINLPLQRAAARTEEELLVPPAKEQD